MFSRRCCEAERRLLQRKNFLDDLVCENENRFSKRNAPCGWTEQHESNQDSLIVSLSSWLLAASLPARAEAIQLADGTVLNGQLGQPAQVVIKTAEGERTVPFGLLPAKLQKVYWAKADDQKNAAALTDEELASLANEVNLEAWTHVASIGSFRDKPEKRGTGGLVVTKAFNAIEENWASVYSPKDAVGQAGDWSVPLARAREMQARSVQFLQKRWLESFVKAAEAVAARDSGEFATHIRDLKRANLAGEPTRNFFTAK